ncbi:MAG TPA: hypothetical protein VGH74_22205 [Planctomycetaceae bacterium]|jgi:hypothetical protein
MTLCKSTPIAGVAGLGMLGVFLLVAAAGDQQKEPAKAAPAATDKQFEDWWNNLEDEEAVASRALLKLSARPREAVAFLKTKMKPLKIDNDAAFALIDNLASDDEKVWKPAFEELEYFDPRLAVALEALMLDVTDSPARQRMVEVMSGRTPGSLEGEVNLRKVGDDGFNFFGGNGSWWAEHKVERIGIYAWANPKKKWTRAVRAIILLEHIGSPEAVAILKEMSTGHPDARPTKTAVEALARIANGINAPVTDK